MEKLLGPFIPNLYDLFIVGNGFDIAFNYKTSYLDYLESNKSSDSGLFLCFKKSKELGCYTNNDWNGFEKMLCQYLCFIRYLFTSKSIEKEFADETCEGYHEYDFIIDKSLHLDIDNLASFYSIVFSLDKIFIMQTGKGGRIINYKELINTLDNPRSSSIKIVYRDVFSKFETKNEIAEQRIINKINEELLKLEDGLSTYIKDATSSNAEPSPFLQKIIDEHNFAGLLSFNYSFCADNALKINKEMAVHIHGDINNKIVLGIEENMIPNQNIDINSPYGIFFKKLRRITKNCSSKCSNIIDYPIDEDSKVGIYGHSLDLSDRSILEKIFKKKCARYDIYCYGNVDEYKVKLFQIIGIELFEELVFDGKINFIEIPKE